MIQTFSLFVAMGVLSFSSLVAQHDTKEDTSRTPKYSIEEIVVTADRMENKIFSTTSSVAVLRSEEIRSLAAARFADALITIPGFFVVNLDGMGWNPIVSTRGFYGGGEAEYLQVLVDGKKINDLETGLVNWNALPMNNFDAVEISRGASSPLYGDAALGGIINIITRKNNSTSHFLSLGGGSEGMFNVGARSRGFVGRNAYHLYGSSESVRGFREHSHWQGFSVGGDILFPLNEQSSFRLLSANQLTKFDEPGPLAQREVVRERTSSSAYYKDDGKDETRSQTSLEFLHTFSHSSSFEANLSYVFKQSERIRTFTTPAVIINPATSEVMGVYDTSQYGDTKERGLKTNEIGVTWKYNLHASSGAMRNRFSAGFDGDLGQMDNTYYRYFSGFEEDYKRSEPARDTAVVHGKGTRVKFAFYVNYELGIEPLTFTTGIRFDAIHDHYDGTLPPLDVRAKHLALSPKLGINYRYASSPSYAGSVFANVNRSFKAATLDQLFDQRPTEAGVFIPRRDGSYFFTSQLFPPFSNPLLRPQAGTSYEIGTYQRMSFSRNFYGELTASYYQIDMEDEIDFDLATFKYQNLHTTQHRGVESGVKLYLLPGSTMFFNYTWTSVKFTNGNYEGNFLKGIPRNVITVGAAYKFSFGLLTSVMWNFVNGTYLDDENTTLLSYHKANVRCSYTYSPVTVFVDVDNVLNRQYSSTGYILNGITYLYPAAGRIVRGGINLEL